MEALEADITALPFEDGSFDVAIEITVLTVVEDDRRAVRRGSPGDAERRLLLEPAIPRLRREHRTGTVRRYSLARLRSLATDAGMTIARATHANSFLVAPAAGLALAQRPVGHGAAPPTSSRTGWGPCSGASPPPRRVLARRDVPFGLSAIVVAEIP